MKKVETALNEKENQRLNHEAEKLGMTRYAITKKLLVKFLDGEIPKELLLTLLPFWMMVYSLATATIVLI